MSVDRVGTIVIAGPTASGKSALALRLARETGGTIVNADSMQVYGDLRVLTARPSPAEEVEAPHRLFGQIDGAENFSAGRFVAAAAPLLSGLEAAGTPAIVVGGTGLYLRALTEGLSAMPPVPDDVRQAVRRDADGRPTPALHADLLARDPVTAGGVRPNDRQRVLRALEILAASGRPLSAFRGSRIPGPLAGRRLVQVFLAPDRAALRQRIDRRFERMVREGALEEVAALARRRLDPALPVMRAHGVPGLLAHLRGDLSLPEAIARGQADTRAYAKRQFTWFRHQMPEVRSVDPDAAYDEILRQVGPERGPG